MTSHTNPEEEDRKSNSSKLDDLLSRWSREFHVGRDIPAEELARDHPELVEELASRIAHQKNSKFNAPSNSGMRVLPREKCPHQPGDEPLPGFPLIKRLGSGAFGEVWAVGDSKNPYIPKYALKIVTEDRGTHLKVEQEGLIQMNGAGHPHVLQRHWHQVSGNSLVILTELAETSLDKYFSKLRQNCSLISLCAHAVYLLRGVAGALDYLQAEGKLTHQDVKPANLLLIKGRCKLGDFGTVRPLKASPHADADFSSSNNEICLIAPQEANGNDEIVTTRYRSLDDVPWDQAIGQRATLYTAEGAWTPRYAAPERFVRKISTSSDQYSLALTFCELVADTIPFPAQDVDQRRERMNGRMDLEFLPEAIRLAVRLALSPKPENRFPSCAEFILSLRDAILPLVEDSPIKNYLIEIEKGGRWGERKSAVILLPTPPSPRTQSRRIGRVFRACAIRLLKSVSRLATRHERLENPVRRVLVSIRANTEAWHIALVLLALAIGPAIIPGEILRHWFKGFSGILAP